TGLGRSGMPEHSVGFVYLPALAGIVIASMLLAPLGAKLAHRTPGPLLKKVFAALLFVLSTKMLFSFL
ncbi:MAG: TSUP family transporter, partial [Burkholderiales bacterium]|nr:TSUP family transporter [Burkholderiales bacterium]